MAVEHADVELCFIRRANYVPIECLVDDEILSVSDWKTRCTDMFAARARNHEETFVAKDLLSELPALVDPFLKGLALTDFFKPRIYLPESASGLDETDSAN